MRSWTWPDLRESSVVFEDDAIIALNKPTGLSVMGERHETDIVRLAEDSGETLFPVHRIDKVTSGLIVFAKDLGIHGGITRQFNKRTVDKAYLVIARTGDGLPAEGRIDLPLSAGRKGTVRIAGQREDIRWDGDAGRWWIREEDLRDTRIYPSTTHFATILADPECSLLVAEPLTGRRHQIRVHLAWVGHPILGDPLFDKANRHQDERTSLHSWRLTFDAAWLGGERLTIEAPPGEDFWPPFTARMPAGGVGGWLDAARASAGRRRS
jgi:tRNA pseudouridine32 synthase/23S rRNA pseudouridine746 synthase/23S rRNA pseudouridine1911/1915/1917 synthase